MYEPWLKSNNQYAIISAFRKTGIFPLNLDWASENQNALKLLDLAAKTQKFDETFKKERLKEKFEVDISQMNYLDLAKYHI